MNSEGVQALVRNQDSDFKIASTTLLRIARNILENVKEDKFRSIRIDSKAFQDKILPFDGAVQCLLEMGFQEDGDKFTLFTGTSLADLKEILKQIKSATNLKLAKTFSAE
uniref:PUB domain-containing protein n=1 Tax=Ciona savignyi TaxID=51511 RepID=H2ZBE1_CIOSA